MAAIYSDEFRRDADRIVQTSGLTLRQVASDLGGGHSTLGKWVGVFCDDVKLLRHHSFKPSMGGKGNCYDKFAVESFFKSLKAELDWRRHW